MTTLTQADLNAVAWRDFLLHAWSQDDAHAAFRCATGRPQRWRARHGRTTILDVLIDRACAASEDHWGEEYAPKGWREMLTPAGRAALEKE